MLPQLCLCQLLISECLWPRWSWQKFASHLLLLNFTSSVRCRCLPCSFHQSCHLDVPCLANCTLSVLKSARLSIFQCRLKEVTKWDLWLDILSGGWGKFFCDFFCVISSSKERKHKRKKDRGSEKAQLYIKLGEILSYCSQIIASTTFLTSPLSASAGSQRWQVLPLLSSILLYRNDKRGCMWKHWASWNHLPTLIKCSQVLCGSSC